MTYVIDTHPLFWFLTNNKRLSSNARIIFEKAETGESNIIVPSIVLAELMYLFEKQNLRDKFKEVLKRIEIALNYEVYSLDIEVIDISSKIISVKEIHDRIIIATAKLSDCPLITKDEEIINSEEVECIW